MVKTTRQIRYYWHGQKLTIREMGDDEPSPVIAASLGMGGEHEHADADSR